MLLQPGTFLSASKVTREKECEPLKQRLLGCSFLNTINNSRMYWDFQNLKKLFSTLGIRVHAEISTYCSLFRIYRTEVNLPWGNKYSVWRTLRGHITSSSYMVLHSNVDLSLRNGLLPVRSSFWPIFPLFNYASINPNPANVENMVSSYQC